MDLYIPVFLHIFIKTIYAGKNRFKIKIFKGAILDIALNILYTRPVI